MAVYDLRFCFAFMVFDLSSHESITNPKRYHLRNVRRNLDKKISKYFDLIKTAYLAATWVFRDMLQIRSSHVIPFCVRGIVIYAKWLEMENGVTKHHQPDGQTIQRRPNANYDRAIFFPPNLALAAD